MARRQIYPQRGSVLGLQSWKPVPLSQGIFKGFFIFCAVLLLAGFLFPEVKFSNTFYIFLFLILFLSGLISFFLSSDAQKIVFHELNKTQLFFGSLLAIIIFDVITLLTRSIFENGVLLISILLFAGLMYVVTDYELW